MGIQNYLNSGKPITTGGLVGAVMNTKPPIDTGMTPAQYINQYPDFMNPLDPNSGSGYQSSLPFVQQQLSGINLNMAPTNKFLSEAMRTGPSAWANMAQAQQNQLAGEARTRAMDEMAGKTAEARTQLATHGGLSSGAMERVARNGLGDYINASQDISRQGMNNANQISLDDEKNRIQQLSMAPGMQLQALEPQMEKARILSGAQASDNSTLMNLWAAMNAYNMNRYNSIGSMIGNIQLANTMNA